MILTIIGYFSVVYTVTLATLAVGVWFKLPAPWIITLWIAGTAAGFMSATLLQFALMPWVLKSMFRTRALEDPNLNVKIKTCFLRAGINPIETRVLIDSHWNKNAFVAGFSRGKKWFSPALFITEPMIRETNEKQFEATLLHEVSHVALSHLKKRLIHHFIAIPTFLLTSLAFAGAFYYLEHFTFEKTTAAIAFGLLKYITPALVAIFGFSHMQSHSRRQELEADAYAVLKLGADAESLISMLKTMSGPAGGKFFSSHPATEERIAALQAHLKVIQENDKKAA
jgi:Zn-dependent protease with chaperone function